ncbi:MAG: hypothetical protein ACI9ON_003759 [Limisphaerales bacterium]|jgi:hypothetical protein
MRAVILVGLLLVGSNATGSFEDGNTLLSKCERESGLHRNICYGYLQGISDSIDGSKKVFPDVRSSQYCIDKLKPRFQQVIN